MESFSYERCSKVFLWSLLIVWLASPEAKTWRWGNTTLSGLALRPLEVELSQWIKQRIDLELSAGEHEAKERKIQKSILCFVNCDNILIYGRFTAWHGFNLNRTVSALVTKQSIMPLQHGSYLLFIKEQEKHRTHHLSCRFFCVIDIKSYEPERWDAFSEMPIKGERSKRGISPWEYAVFLFCHDENNFYFAHAFKMHC